MVLLKKCASTKNEPTGSISLQPAIAGVATVLDASIKKRKEKDDVLSGIPAIVDVLQRNQIECRVFE